MRPEFLSGSLQHFPYRDWIRENMPSGEEGFIAEDGDLVMRLYGPKYGLDEKGIIYLVELKHDNQKGESSDFNGSQKRTYGLQDELMRAGDPTGKRYWGFYIIQYSEDDWNKASFKINYKPVSREEFLKFWEDPRSIEPLKSRDGRFTGAPNIPIKKEVRPK
jgi:hypothetical protein